MRHKQWSQEEIDELIAIRHNMSLTELSRKFNCSYSIIVNKLHKLGITVYKKRSLEDKYRISNCKTIDECLKLSIELDISVAYIVRERLNSGKKNFRIYEIWQSMVKRCYNDHCKRYPRYGGRGITICNEWISSFETFYEWAMNNGYEPHLTLDRTNNDNSYCPNNCRWVTYKVNGNNKSNVRKITAFGETKTISDWLEDPRCKVPRSTIYWRFYGTPQDFVTNEDRLSMQYKEYISLVKQTLNKSK